MGDGTLLRIPGRLRRASLPAAMRRLVLTASVVIWSPCLAVAFESGTADVDPPAEIEQRPEESAPEPTAAEKADSASEAESDGEPESETDSAAGPEKPVAPPDGPTVDDLIERIDPTAKSPLDEARERLERAIENMRSAKDRLAEEDTGADTRNLQSRAVDDLEKLLEALQNPPPSQQNQNQSQSQNQSQNQSRSQNQQRQRQSKSQQQRQRKQSSRNRRSQSQRQRQQQAQRQSQPQPQPGERAEQPTGAEERTDAARRKAEEEARRRSVADDVWGHLPPSVREALQKSFNEKYLPKYEELVRRYYESLAEQNRGRGRRE